MQERTFHYTSQFHWYESSCVHWKLPYYVGPYTLMQAHSHRQTNTLTQTNYQPQNTYPLYPLKHIFHGRHSSSKINGDIYGEPIMQSNSDCNNKTVNCSPFFQTITYLNMTLTKLSWSTRIAAMFDAGYIFCL